MDKYELEKKTKTAIQEVSTKLTDLKYKLSQDNKPQIKADMQAALDELDSLKQEINKQYERIGSVSDKSDAQMSEIENNIYSSIETFNDAFTKAGSLFKVH